MRVPNAGQDLVERRIVREGKRLAEVMLADYVDRPLFSLGSLPDIAATSLRWLRKRVLGLPARY